MSNRWYLASKNSGLFIIDRPPRPSDDYENHNSEPPMVLNVTRLTREQAEEIVAAHNAAIDREIQRVGDRVCQLYGFN